MNAPVPPAKRLATYTRQLKLQTVEWAVDCRTNHLGRASLRSQGFTKDHTNSDTSATTQIDPSMQNSFDKLAKNDAFWCYLLELSWIMTDNCFWDLSLRNYLITQWGPFRESVSFPSNCHFLNCWSIQCYHVEIMRCLPKSKNAVPHLF